MYRFAMSTDVPAGRPGHARATAPSRRFLFASARSAGYRHAMSRAPLCPRVDTSRRFGMGASLYLGRQGLSLLGWRETELARELDRSCQVLLFGVGLRDWHRAHPGRGVPADHFLAARDGGWIPVGIALVASSSGSEHLVVLAGKRLSSGVGSPSSRSSPPSFPFC